MEEGLGQQATSSQTPNWLLIVAIVLITGLIAGGGVYAWQRSQINNLKAEQQKKVQELKQEIQSLEQEIKRLSELRESGIKEEKSKIPEDWRTYRNQEYGFEFKYPPIKTSIKETQDCVEITRDIKGYGGDLYSFQVCISDQSKYNIESHEDLISWFKEKYNSQESSINISTQVDEVPAVTVGYSRTYSTHITFLLKNGKLFEITRGVSTLFATKDTESPIILSSFKFID